MMFVVIAFNDGWYSPKDKMQTPFAWFNDAIRFFGNNKDVLIISPAFCDKFFRETEKNLEKLAEYEQVAKSFVEDEIFERKFREHGNNLAAAIDLYSNRYVRLEKKLIRIIDEESRKRQGAKVEAIFNFAEAFASVRYLGEYYNCPIIKYETTAVRSWYGYKFDTRFAGTGEYFLSSEEACLRYKKFCGETDKRIIFSRRELLALLGKKRNFPLLKLLDSQPKYEVGVCLAPYAVLPNSFHRVYYNDDDVLREVHRNYSPNQFISRMHPLKVRHENISLKNVRSDPASFILSCKRLAAVNSNMLIKALLWNRTPFMKKDLHHFFYLCEQDITSENKVSNEAISYFMLGITIPMKIFYDLYYWRWRINERPTETEIYNRHLKFYLEELDADMSILEKLEEEDRFKYLLEKRGCDPDVMNQLLDGERITEINFDVLTSRLVIGDEQDEIKIDMSRATSGEILKFMKCEVKSKIIDTVNRYEDGKVFTSHKITLEKNCNVLVFYPFLDLEAKAKINSVVLDGENLQISSGGEFLHFYKFKGWELKLDLPAGEHEISIEWEYKLL